MTFDDRTLATEAAVIRGRLLLRTDATAAIAYVCEQLAAAGPCSTRPALVVLEGVAHARLGDSRAAAACFDAAERAARSDVHLFAEIAYQRAVAHWIERRLEAATAVLDAAGGVFERANRAGNRSLAVLVPLLRGTIASSSGDFASQGAFLIAALEAVGDRASADVYFWATVVEQIASLARELPSPKLRALALEELPRIPWTDDVAQLHFLALRSVGWSHALQGDTFNAFRMLREAATCAPSDACRVMARCDRSYLAEALGEPSWSLQELDEASELAGRVDWASCRGDERAALVLLAELFAPRDHATALMYLSRYRATRGSVDATRSSRNDRRVDAMEAYSFGVVQRERGLTDDALHSFLEAWAIYDAIGYDWRAGRVAMAVARLTDEAEWKDRARRKLEPYPRSWLGVRAASEISAPTSPSERASVTATAISPAQAAVYALLLRGLSNAAIASELGRSEFTVRNHVKAIFTAYGVHSRSELIAQQLGGRKA